MVSSLATKLQDRLSEAEVIVRVERRGRDPNPGRPDAVVWLRPSTVCVPWLVPLLVELEGASDTTASYHACKQDLTDFTARHDPENRSANDEFAYHIAWPTLDWDLGAALRETAYSTNPATEPAPVTVPVDYEIFSVPAVSVAGSQEASDDELQKAVRKHFRPARAARTTPDGFTTEVSTWQRGATEIVIWTVHWELHNQNEGSVDVPFIVQAGPGLARLLENEVAPVSVPMMAVLNGSPPARAEEKTYDTGVRFPNISPATITHA